MKEKPGALLKKTRESRGLSQDDVVKRLRLKLRIIQDIENDDYKNISAMVYMRGYLRAYSRLLGLKEDEVLQSFSELQIVDPIKSMQDPRLSQLTNHDEIVEASLPWLRWSLFGLLGLLIIAALLVWWTQEKAPRKTASHAVITLPQTAVIIPANPEAEQTSVATSAVAANPPVDNALAQMPDTSETNTAEIKKPHKKPTHVKSHPSHKVAHNALKPNYTLSPVTEPATN